MLAASWLFVLALAAFELDLAEVFQRLVELAR